jgi:MFS family permease
VFISGIGLGLTAPLTALFASALGASALLAGFAVSAVSLSLLPLDFFGTRFIPRVEGRAAMCFALAVFGLGSIASAFAPGWKVMTAARVVQGVGAAFFMGGGLQLAVRGARRPERAIGTFNAAWFAGVAVGPLLSGALVALGDTRLQGLRLAFLVCGVVNLLGAAVVRLSLPRLPSVRRAAFGLPRIGGLGGVRGAGVLAQSTLGQAVRAGVALTMVPFFGHERLGLSSLVLGLALSALAVTDITTMGLAGRLVQRHGRFVVLLVALLWGIAAVLALSRTTTVWLFVPAAMAVGVTVGATWVVPVAMAVDVADDAEDGLAAYRISSDLGMLLGGVAAGAAVGAVGAEDAFWCAAAVLAGGALLALAIGDTRPAAPLAERAPLASLQPDPT